MKRVKLIDPAALGSIFDVGDVIELDDEEAQGYIDRGAVEETSEELSPTPEAAPEPAPEEVTPEAVEAPPEAPSE